MTKYVVFVLFLTASLASAQPVGPPNLDGWKLVDAKETNLDVKVQAGGLVFTAYFGLMENYQNPKDPTEFAMVIKRHVPVISIVEDDQQKLNLQTEVVSNYSRKASHDALDKVRMKADSIAYTKWHIVKDPRTGEDVRTGNTESWLRVQNGDWVSGLGVIGRELYSEISPNTKMVTLVGVKFLLGTKYHIIRVDQADLATKKEEKK